MNTDEGVGEKGGQRPRTPGFIPLLIVETILLSAVAFFSLHDFQSRAAIERFQSIPFAKGNTPEPGAIP